jgi:hypothetical protein
MSDVNSESTDSVAQKLPAKERVLSITAEIMAAKERIDTEPDAILKAKALVMASAASAEAAISNATSDATFASDAKENAEAHPQAVSK